MAQPASASEVRIWNGCRTGQRPPLTYKQLIEMALRSRTNKCMKLQEIYTWIRDKFPYYGSVKKQGWQNSIRHNLTIYQTFVRDDQKYWTLYSELSNKPAENIHNSSVNCTSKNQSEPVKEKRNAITKMKQRKGLTRLLPKPAPRSTPVLITVPPGASIVTPQPVIVASSFSSQQAVKMRKLAPKPRGSQDATTYRYSETHITEQPDKQLLGIFSCDIKSDMADFKVPGEHIYNGMVMADIFPAEVLDRVPDFEFHTDDVLIVTYPKAGTTWLQQITWLIMNAVDIDTSRKMSIRERSAFIEKEDSIDMLPQMNTPRIIKTHLPYCFFKKPIEGEGKPRFKTVVVMRNVKDLLVSYYHFYKMNGELGNFNQNFDAFFDLFKDKKLVHGDYFDHVLSWWKERENPNLYFLKYEDMKADPKVEIKKLATFLGKDLSDTEVEAIVKESSFESMQKNPMTNMSFNPKFDFGISKFIRKGEVGGWKKHFSEEQIEYVDSRSEKELVPHGLHF